MDQEEIFAEKIRAVLTRNKARDLYDLYFLIKQGIKTNKEIMDKKLKYCRKKWDYNEFIKSLKQKERLWDKELKNLISSYPSFKEVKREVEKILKNLK